MLRIVKLGILSVSLTFALVHVPILKAGQKEQIATAPVPAKLITGKKIFISNAGVDSSARTIFDQAAGSDNPYNLFYAAMKSWGRYELAADPADADLVFEIRLRSTSTYDLELTILDGKTPFKLWALSESVESAVRKSTWQKNLNAGVANLVNDLRKLTQQPGAATDSTSK